MNELSLGKVVTETVNDFINEVIPKIFIIVKNLITT